MVYDIHCMKCGVKVAEVRLPEGQAYPGDAYYGFLCEACATQQQAEEPRSEA
jgi:hypothetical protein